MPLATVTPAAAATVTAMPAYRFVNAVGVATHFDWGLSVYARRFDEVSAALGELGVRHIRQHPGNRSASVRLNALHKLHGVKITAVIDMRVGTGNQQQLDPGSIARKLSEMKAQLDPNMIEALEGPNEWNVTARNYGRTTWPQELRAYQAELHRQIKADPALQRLPVIAPSLSDPLTPGTYPGQYANLGNLEAWTDRANAHVYPNWLPFERKVNDVIAFARASFPTQPFWVTESGWHTALNSSAQFVDEATKMKYLGRAMATYASHPQLQRVYYYQLIDDENNVELTKSGKNMALIQNTLVRKPSFYAVRNTMAVMCDNAPTFAPGSLDYTLSGDLTDVRTLLFQKNTGAFYLLVWLEQRGFYKGKPIVNPPRQLRLNLAAPIATMRSYRTTDPTADPTQGHLPKSTQSGVAQFDLTIADQLSIFELVPYGVATPAINDGRCNFRPL